MEKKKTGLIITEMILVMMLACACAAGQHTETAGNGVNALTETAALGQGDGETESAVAGQTETETGSAVAGQAETETELAAAGQAETETGSAAPEQPDTAPDPDVVSALSPDLNHDGIAEEVRLKKTDKGQSLVIWQGDEWTWREESHFTDEPQISHFLCTLDGEDYILSYETETDQGVGTYEYKLSVLEGNEKRTVKQDRIDFDLNFGAPFHKDFDAEAVALFMCEVNALLSRSVPLLNTDEHLLATFEREGRLYDSLWWLDAWEQEYQRDESKSLLENMKDFQTAMTAAWTLKVLEVADNLPFTEPLEMGLGIGVSGWNAHLTLQPDGSFTGDYFSGNMDVNYPEQYECRFHGKFGKAEKLSDASWRLTLTELMIDTGHDVGERWDETDEYGTVHYISRAPYGFTDEKERVLETGAQFMLYSPEARGHEPGTELYGAVEFQAWSGKEAFQSTEDKLGRWGLQNALTGDGYFAEK